MKKILLSIITTLIIFNCLILGVNAATITSDQIDINSSYIQMPSELVSEKQATIGLSNLDGALGYYQIINITNNQDLLNAYDGAQQDNTKLDTLVTTLNNDSAVTNDENWNSINENEGTFVFTPSFEAASGDKMLLVVKYQSQTDTKYNLKVYGIEGATSTDDEEVKNSDTGIADWYLVIVPIAIIAGAVLVTKKNRYE